MEENTKIDIASLLFMAGCILFLLVIVVVTVQVLVWLKSGIWIDGSAVAIWAYFVDGRNLVTDHGRDWEYNLGWEKSYIDLIYERFADAVGVAIIIDYAISVHVFWLAFFIGIILLIVIARMDT